MNLTTLLGLAAAVCTTLSFLPQAVKTIQTKNTTGISLSMYALFTFGTLLWFLYGLFSTNHGGRHLGSRSGDDISYKESSHYRANRNALTKPSTFAIMESPVRPLQCFPETRSQTLQGNWSLKSPKEAIVLELDFFAWPFRHIPERRRSPVPPAAHQSRKPCPKTNACFSMTANPAPLA